MMERNDQPVRPRRVAFETLGCKLNQYEAEAVAADLARRGHEVVATGEAADVYVVNGCTVTNKADRKSRNAYYRAVRAAGDDKAMVILTGCAADRVPTDARTYHVENRRKHHIPDLIEAHFRGETVALSVLERNPFGFAVPGVQFRTRTNLKVQDGCDNFCTFCIIPHVRGRAISRDPAAVLNEARAAIAAGSHELVLTGVNMSRYHAADVSFTTLIERLVALPGDFRVRISSLEPDLLDARFVQLFEHPKMCPHLHLCLQSGNDRVLAAMRRMYTVDSYRAVVRALRRVDARFSLTTDLIVGFPGETTKEFEESMAFISEIGFAHVHIFPYSRRSGTPADRMPGQISTGEMRDRIAEAQRIALHEKRCYRRTFVGVQERVLVEHVESGMAGYGFGRYYVPIRLTPGPSWPDGAQIVPNRFHDVTITAVEDDELAGEPARLTGVC